jgi:hypothetical protein
MDNRGDGGNDGNGPNGDGDDGEAPERVVLWYVPSLKASLILHEKMKGAPLTEAEVEDIRDNAAAVLVRPDMLAELIKDRGYEDLDPADCWEQWQVFRATLKKTEE